MIQYEPGFVVIAHGNSGRKTFLQKGHLSEKGCGSTEVASIQGEEENA
jgi:hypothetical protein